MKSALGWGLLVVGIGALIAFQAALFANVQGPAVPPEPVANTAELSLEPRVIVTRQDAQGVKEVDLDAAGAQRFADYAAQRASHHAAQYAERQGWEIPPNPVTGEGVLIELDGRRLVVIRLKADGLVVTVEVAGVEGTELVRVACSGDGQNDAKLTDPACIKQIERTFAVRIAPDSE